MHEQLYSARQLAHWVGEPIEGRYVLTEKIGDWPGGLAQVIEWMPDYEEDIVLTVQQGERTIGVFGDEALIIIHPAFRLPDGIV